MPRIDGVNKPKPPAKINWIRCPGEVVEVDSLTPDPDNARLHPEANLESIKESLSRHGQLKPLVVRAENRVVVAGNGTLEAAKALGWTEIAVNLVDLSHLEAMGYGLADNRTAELAVWDVEVVARLARLQQEAGENPIGWTAEDLVALRMGAPVGDVDKIPPIPANPVTRLGDLWILGEHRILCGDSACREHVGKLLGKHKASLMATDPPYGVAFGEANHNPRSKSWAPIVGDKRAGGGMRSWLAGAIKCWIPSIRMDSAVYVWSAPLAEGHRCYEALIDAGLHVQSQIVWVKNVFNLGQADYQWKHEPCWYAFFKGHKHRWYGGRDKTTTWEVKRLPTSAYLHPAQKPVELYEIPLENHTTAGDIVVDPFLGSGTQLIAAQKLRRVCYAMELDPTYVDVSLRRWSEYTGLDPVRERDGAKFSELV